MYGKMPHKKVDLQQKVHPVLETNWMDGEMEITQPKA